MNEFDKTWREGLTDYAIKIAKIYAIHPEQILNVMGFESVVGTLNQTYISLVNNNELPKIESLPVERKIELWEKSKVYSDSKKQCELICRSIYLLDELTKL